METSNDGLKHAWDWFDLHAKQRMQSINFYIVITAALVAATGASIKESEYAIGALLGITIIVCSILFLVLERRVRQLVRLGEKALAIEQMALSKRCGNPHLNFIAESNISAKHGLTYGNTFLAMFSCFCIIGVSITWYSISKIEIDKEKVAHSTSTINTDDAGQTIIQETIIKK